MTYRYRKSYVSLEKLHIFSSELDSKFVCRRCLSSYTSENALMKNKQRYEQHNKK